MKKLAMNLSGFAFLFGPVILVLWWFIHREIHPAPSVKSPPYQMQLRADQKEALTELHSKNLLDLEEKNHRAYIDPLAWAVMNAHQKEDFAAGLGDACADFEKSNSGNFVDVFDRQSGKKLATWSAVWGFKVIQ